MIPFIVLDDRVPSEQLGYLPGMLSEHDPRPAREQLNSNYPHGGWRPMKKGFRLASDYSLLYPGDPPLKPWAQANLRDEIILVYSGDWVLILQPNWDFEVSRMD